MLDWEQESGAQLQRRTGLCSWCEESQRWKFTRCHSLRALSSLPLCIWEHKKALFGMWEGRLSLILKVLWTFNRALVWKWSEAVLHYKPRRHLYQDHLPVILRRITNPRFINSTPLPPYVPSFSVAHFREELSIAFIMFIMQGGIIFFANPPSTPLRLSVCPSFSLSLSHSPPL